MGSVQFSRSVVSYSLLPLGLQHARLPCPPTTTEACSNSWLLGQECHPTISSSVVPFSSRLQSFPGSGSFQRSQFFTSGGQSIRVSASASVLPMNTQDWFPLGLTGWISLQSRGLTSLVQHHSSKLSILQHSAFFKVQLSHPYMATGKTIASPRWTFISKVMSLLFNMLSRLVIAFSARSRHHLISWLQSPLAVILELKKKSLSLFPLFPHRLVFWMLTFKPVFSLSSFTFIKKLFFCHKGGVICISEVIDISPGNLDSSLCFIQSSVSHDIFCL